MKLLKQLLQGVSQLLKISILIFLTKDTATIVVVVGTVCICASG